MISLLIRIPKMVKIGLKLAKLQSYVTVFNNVFCKNGNDALTYWCIACSQRNSFTPVVSMVLSLPEVTFVLLGFWATHSQS